MILLEQLGFALPERTPMSALTTEGFPLSRPFVLQTDPTIVAAAPSNSTPVGVLCATPFSALSLNPSFDRSSEPTKRPTGGDGSAPDEDTDDPVD